MSDLRHLWKVGQQCVAVMDGKKRQGTVKEVYEDHVIVDIPTVSDHCWFESGLNLDALYPLYKNR
jgi:hypothetical protein